ncbi:MAG: peptidoglycan editing factor PgeF [Mycobacteriales bacterium]|nr:peptidoglycan editing factor PgeF [Frankia sp.]
MSPATAVFTTRAGGCSDPPYASLNLARHVGDDPRRVARNRQRLAALLDLPSNRLMWAEQVHGGGVTFVDESSLARGAAPDGWAAADGLVTALADVALVVQAADCLPVLLADPASGVVGAAHAGRRGVTTRVIENVLAAMVSLGAIREQVSAAIGPGIGSCCYELPAEVVAAFETATPGTATTTRAGTPSVDLRRAVADRLHAAGVTAVADVGGCTVDDARLFSHRRDGVTGRHAGVVVRRATR